MVSDEKSEIRLYGWTSIRGLVMGQILAFLVGMTGLTSSELSEKGINTPLTQTLLNYLLLCVCFGTIFFSQKRTTEMPWYYYLVLAAVDVEANFCVVWAYQYTSLTSVALLDCWAIPCSMLLSIVFLHNRYSRTHFLAVLLCVAGLLMVFLSDVHSGDWRKGSNNILGDGLVILGSTLYAVSNVLEEFLVKKVSRIELLAMLGFYGASVNLVQLMLLEGRELQKVKWNIQIVLLYAGFALALFLFYAMAPVMLQVSGSAMFNLSLLMSDIWAVAIRAFVFHQKVDLLFYLAFGMVACGLVLYSRGENEIPCEDNVHREGNPTPEDLPLLLSPEVRSEAQ